MFQTANLAPSLVTIRRTRTLVEAVKRLRDLTLSTGFHVLVNTAIEN
jgi:hypothetical protein